MNLAAFRQRFPDDAACRAFLEQTVWAKGRFCPHCGSMTSCAIRGEKSRPGLYQCRDCNKQFTVTTKTWLHGHKLPLNRYFEIIYLQVNSSFGMASTRIAEWTGVSQKSVWKILQAFRHLQGFWLDLKDQLGRVVELDGKYVGGKPRKQEGVKHKRGKGTAKQPVLVVVERQGEVRATVVPNDKLATIQPLVRQQVDPSAHLMSDEDSVYAILAKDFAGHSTVNHGQGEFARDGVHNNTAESFNSWVEHMRDVHFYVSKPHMQRYLNDVMSGWNLRMPVQKVVRSGRHAGEVRVQMERMPLLDRLGEIFAHSVGRQMRRNRNTGGIYVVQNLQG